MLNGDSFEQVVKATRKNPYAHWSTVLHKADQIPNFPDHAVNRIHNGFADVFAVLPRKFAAADAFFCIGSCFARNLEEQMAKRDLNPITRTLSLEMVQAEPRLFDKQEHLTLGRPNQFLNRFNVPSMAHVIEDMLHDTLGDRLLYGQRSGGEVVDLHFTRSLTSLPIDDARRRRRLVREMYRKAFDEAAIFVFTLGLCECFYDADEDVYLNVTPGLRTVANRNLQFTFNDQATNVSHLRRMISLIHGHKPGADIIFTVSPVPLDCTFTGMDIVTANMLAKSTLLCSIFEAIAGSPNCHYYPSYEMALHSNQSMAWKRDKKHVADDMVAHIISRFIDQNFETAPTPDPAHG